MQVEVWVYVHQGIYACARAYVNVCVSTCVYAYIYTCIFTCMCMDTQIIYAYPYVHRYITHLCRTHIYMYIYVHIYMYAYTHITCPCIHLYSYNYLHMCIFMEIYQMILFPDRTSVTLRVYSVVYVCSRIRGCVLCVSVCVSVSVCLSMCLRVCVYNIACTCVCVWCRRCIFGGEVSLANR